MFPSCHTNSNCHATSQYVSKQQHIVYTKHLADSQSYIGNICSLVGQEIRVCLRSLLLVLLGIYCARGIILQVRILLLLCEIMVNPQRMDVNGHCGCCIVTRCNDVCWKHKQCLCLPWNRFITTNVCVVQYYAPRDKSSAPLFVFSHTVLKILPFILCK